MTHKHSFLNEYPGEWQLFGEINLIADFSTNNHINTWLVETLRPLKLNVRFLDKILASAALAARSDPASDEAAPEQVRLLVYMSEESQSNGQSWGFFRVEKKGDPHSSEPNQDHVIAFYLYREGI